MIEDLSYEEEDEYYYAEDINEFEGKPCHRYQKNKKSNLISKAEAHLYYSK